MSIFLPFAQQAPAGGPSMGAFLFQIVAIIAIFYFVMIRPQQQERKRHEAALRALKKGDEVITAGGLVGEVLHIPAPVGDAGAKDAGAKMDDRITIKTGEAKVLVERGRIARVVTPTAP
jgi:preprotein translocase subunit YajC